MVENQLDQQLWAWSSSQSQLLSKQGTCPIPFIKRECKNSVLTLQDSLKSKQISRWIGPTQVYLRHRHSKPSGIGLCPVSQDSITLPSGMEADPELSSKENNTQTQKTPSVAISMPNSKQLF